MEITRQRIKIDYAPLTAAVSLVCLSKGSPLTQVFNGATGLYEPDRDLTATVIKPLVIVNASDGSLSSPYGNSMLAEMHWYVLDEDGESVDMATDSEWSEYVEIATSGSDRGTLTLSKNIPVGKQYSIHFEAVIADTRLGVNVPIVSDELVLSTTDASEDAYSLEIAEDTAIKYNPFEDKLYAYEYKVAHGQIEADADTEEAATDSNCYLRTIPITLYRGTDALDADGYTIKVFQLDGTTQTELTADDTNEFNEISSSQIVMDLRLVTKADYVVKAYVEDEIVSQIQYSVNRLYPKYRVKAKNGCDFAPTDKTRYDEAMVSSNGNIVENPGNLILMVWYTDTANKTGLQHNEGEKCQYVIDDTGIGKTSSTNWLEQYIMTEHKEALSVAVNEDGDELTDEDGNQYIFN